MTPNFKKEELACRCGCGMLPEQDFMHKVQRLRDVYGKSLTVTSAARCPAHNARVSKTGGTGPHTTGRAIDLAVRGGEAYQVAKIAFNMGFSGIGFNQTGSARFIHLDDLVEGRPAVWSY